MDLQRLNLPGKVADIVGKRTFDTDRIGMSSAQVISFEDMVLKIERTSETSDNEHQMMQWLRGKLPVPEIIAFEQQDGVNYLLMSKIPGRMLCSADILDDDERLVRLMAQAFEMLWQVNVDSCPGKASVDHKLKLAGRRVEKGLCSMDNTEPETYGPGGFDSPEHLLHWLEENKPEESRVLTHGDFCLPNIFTDGKNITGFIDFGFSGPADRYADIAIGLRSMRHNLDGSFSSKTYPPVSPQRIFNRLGFRPDEELIRYYLLLDELF